MRKILFVPDTHAPYHSRTAWALMIKAARVFKPDTIVTLGDFFDFYSVSSHSKDPSRERKLLKEIKSAVTCLEDLNALKAERKIFVSGNHEDRFDRYVAEKTPELHSLLTIPAMLGLEEAGWEYIPYKSHVNIGKLFITHEVGNAGAYAHYKALDTFQGNIILGHTHRLGYTVVGNAKGKAHVGAMFGWLGDFGKVDYMHRIQALRGWAHGFGVGYEFSDGTVHVTPVPIVGTRCIIEGKEVML